jgi:DMSO/TMAO reductase YedYZ molybdopterin-dependent catalytic subunit
LLSAAIIGLRGNESARENLIVRSAHPEDYEMPLSGFGSWLTPVDRFYVRTHVSKPNVDLAAWRLRVDGLVEQDVTFDLAELKRLPRAELVAVLECAGNGRSFFEPGVAGLQWQTAPSAMRAGPACAWPTFCTVPA